MINERAIEEPSLRITEIFCSIQGESTRVGLPTVFVRLTGCPLRCVYCDTAYAFKGGEKFSLEAILEKVQAYGVPYITVTGGEPLAQPCCFPLLTALCNKRYQVSLETSGAMDVSAVDPRVVKVLDIKTPGSGEVDKNLLSNLGYLTPQDEVKFVLCDAADYDWAKTFVYEHHLNDICHVLFSPSHGQLEPSLLADWIVRDALPLRLQVQLHKYLWADEPGR